MNNFSDQGYMIIIVTIHIIIIIKNWYLSKSVYYIVLGTIDGKISKSNML